MGQVRIRSHAESDVTELTRLLIEEFQQLTPSDQQPLIVIERPGSRVHLLVVWDSWSELTQRERSRIILDAYETARGVESAIDVSVAMGLTMQEAQRLGYDFAPL